MTQLEGSIKRRPDAYCKQITVFSSRNLSGSPATFFSKPEFYWKTILHLLYIDLYIRVVVGVNHNIVMRLRRKGVN